MWIGRWTSAADGVGVPEVTAASRGDYNSASVMKFSKSLPVTPDLSTSSKFFFRSFARRYSTDLLTESGEAGVVNEEFLVPNTFV